MRVGIHEAKNSLFRLILAALSGEEIIITKSGIPLVKLVPVENPGRRRPLGFYADKIKFLEDVSAPLPEDIINDFWSERENDGVSA